MDKNQSTGHLWVDFIRFVDRLLLPIALGMATMLLMVQSLTAIPSVRSFVDTETGHFAEVPAKDIVPSAAFADHAMLTLYLSPRMSRPDFEIMVNGQLVGAFIHSSVSIRVANGDVIQIRTPLRHGNVLIFADQDNSRLFVPAPGQTFDWQAGTQVITLPTVQFTS